MGILYSSHDVDADEDDYEKVKQVDLNDDGSVGVYNATDGDFANGHGHREFNSMSDYDDAQNSGNSSTDTSGQTWAGRSPDDEKSKGRKWYDPETGDKYNYDERQM